MIELTNDLLILWKAFCIYVEPNFDIVEIGVDNIGNYHADSFGVSFSDTKRAQILEVYRGDNGEVLCAVLPGWRWRIDRLLEAVPDNEPINFWGWGVDHTGYIFPILGNGSDCERVEFVSSSKLKEGKSND